jgi:iron complex outermembrane receptor protein
LIAGLRYTNEDKSLLGENRSNSPGAPTPLFFPLTGDKAYDKMNWKLGLEYDVTDQNLLYFTVGTGFKAGGFFAEQAQYGNTFDPEELTAYALGSKNRFIDNRLQLNIEVFYWDYEDHQESHLALSPGLYAIFPTENIGQATMQGVDIEGEFLLTANDRFVWQLQYLDATFDEFTYKAFSPAGPPLTGANYVHLGGPFYNIVADGFEAMRAPEWSGTLGYIHNFPLGVHGNLVLDLRSQYFSETYTGLEYLPEQLADAHTRSDVYLTYMSAANTWSLGIWARNLEDEAVKTGGFVAPFAPLVYGPLRPPRTYGVNFRLNF